MNYHIIYMHYLPYHSRLLHGVRMVWNSHCGETTQEVLLYFTFLFSCSANRKLNGASGANLPFLTKTLHSGCLVCVDGLAKYKYWCYVLHNWTIAWYKYISIVLCRVLKIAQFCTYTLIPIHRKSFVPGQILGHAWRVQYFKYSDNYLFCMIYTMDYMLCWLCVHVIIALLTHQSRDEMDNISQTTFWNVFSSMKLFEFWLTFHSSLFLMIQLTIIHHWFR